jgi:hypothetical protein
LIYKYIFLVIFETAMTDETDKMMIFIGDPRNPGKPDIESSYDSLTYVHNVLSSTSTEGSELVQTSVKLHKVTLEVLERNADILGVTKTDLHRKALEIGLNDIAKAYSSLVQEHPEVNFKEEF